MESKTFTVGAPKVQLTIYLSTADPAEEFQPSVKHYHSPQNPKTPHLYLRASDQNHGC